jgi:phosphoribosyl-ATP pyrophosphohydrolase
MSDAQENALVLERLFAVIESRKGGDADASYTAKLLSRGTEKIAQKVGEEAVETVIAAMGTDIDALAGESADLLYHLLVLWADKGLDPAVVWTVLAEREGISGIAEKASRTE